MHRKHSLITRYGAAVGFTALSVATRWACDPLLGDSYPIVLSIAAVVASAWTGGLGPGLVSLGLGATSAYFLFARWGADGLATLRHGLGLALFLGTGLLISLICESLRRSRESAEGRAGELTRLRQAERAADRTKDETLALLDSMLDNAPVGFAFFDRRHRYLKVNNFLAALNGFPAADHVGRRLEDVLPLSAPVLGPLIDRVFEAGEPVREQEIEGQTWAESGLRRHWLCGLYPVRVGDGRIGSVGVVVTEITERKRAETLLREAMEAAESASRAKDQFLATLSHELRTPLTPVLAEVSAMLDDPETLAEVRPVLESAQRNIALEAKLIDDLLDVTRISQGKLTIRREPVHAHLLIQRALEICRTDVESAGLDLIVELRATSAFVEGDPSRLQQVFWNLVKNAVKFTPRGGTIVVRSWNKDDGSRLVIEVEDNGIGIPGESLPRIFDAFEQGSQAVTRRFGGLGLGLAITRSLVALHGGRLSARSDGPDRGSTFAVELDTVEPPAPSEEADDDGDGEDVDGRSLRVLLVEDNEDTLRVMARLLRKSGHEVETAVSLATALDAAGPGDFDVVVSDLGLPDGSGLDLMRRLGGRDAVRGVALSGFGSEADLRESRDAGFQVHLIKPVDFRSLESAIRLVSAPRNGNSDG